MVIGMYEFCEITMKDDFVAQFLSRFLRKPDETTNHPQIDKLRK